jgi:hypothetical protein
MVLVGETEVLGENLPQRHFVHHKSHLTDPDANPGRRGGKPATNRFSYGVAIQYYINFKDKTTSSHNSTEIDFNSITPKPICKS